MDSQNTLIEILNAQLKKLEQIMSESTYSTTSMINEKFFRWHDNTSEIIKRHINVQEAERFRKCQMFIKIKDRISNCDSYLKVLIDDIKDNPDRYANISEKSQNDNFVNSMHKKIVQVASIKIQNKDYRGAILDSCTALDNYVKEKININKIMDMSGVKLMECVFSKDKPIIKLSDKPEEQKGFMFLFSGVMKAVRNPSTHKLHQLDSLSETLEILGFLSFLFRLVDKGKR